MNIASGHRGWRHTRAEDKYHSLEFKPTVRSAGIVIRMVTMSDARHDDP
jgi:hypothetical protein